MRVSVFDRRYILISSFPKLSGTNDISGRISGWHAQFAQQQYRSARKVYTISPAAVHQKIIYRILAVWQRIQIHTIALILL